MHAFLDELTWRGLVFDQTPALRERLGRGPIAGYVGFDPTAASLQLGNLVPVMLLAHLQRAGGTPIVLVGGGTGMIGDPSGKSEERPLLTTDQIDDHVDRQRRQLERFLDFGRRPNAARMRNNADWLRPLVLVDFLRDTGKHFTISWMLQKESVKSRLEGGISFTEFSYMLLQAYDFLHLYRTEECELQLGGSDQWGNITAGVELIRRAGAGEAHGLCAPLITTAAGTKFGKSEGAAVWLDPEMTSPYKFYQFWVNADDRDVESYLKIFTFMTGDEIAGLMAQHAEDRGRRTPQHALAHDLTARVHGDDIARRVAAASRVIFQQGDIRDADAETWETLSHELPHWETTGDALPATIVDLAVASGLTPSKGDARRQLQQGGIYLNGERATPDATIDPGSMLPGGYLWLRRGKKTDVIVLVKDRGG